MNLFATETETLTLEKENEIRQIQDEISNKDMEIRRLHKQLRQNKDTCEGYVQCAQTRRIKLNMI
jgi:hypothetical protein